MYRREMMKEHVSSSVTRLPKCSLRNACAPTFAEPQPNGHGGISSYCASGSHTQMSR
jgi:hypothetical protein